MNSISRRQGCSLTGSLLLCDLPTLRLVGYLICAWHLRGRAVPCSDALERHALASHRSTTLASGLAPSADGARKPDRPSFARVNPGLNEAIRCPI